MKTLSNRYIMISGALCAGLVLMPASALAQSAVKPRLIPGPELTGPIVGGIQPPSNEILDKYAPTFDDEDA